MNLLEGLNNLLSKSLDYFQHQFNQKKTKRLITNAFTLVILVALGIYLYQNQESFSRLKEYSLQDVLVIFFIHIANLFMLGLFNLVMFKRIDPQVRFSDAIFLQYVNNFFNNILSKGGGVYRAIYLKTVYQFPYTKFISSLAGLYVITFLTNSAIGLFSVLIISRTYHQNDLVLTSIFAGVFIVSLFIVFFTPDASDSEYRILRLINSVLVGWRRIKENPVDILSLVIISAVNICLKTVQFFYIYRALGADTSWVKMLYLSALASVMQIINITPSGIGIREAIFAFSSDVLLISDDILVLGSLVIRLISIPASILAGLISYAVLQKRLKEIRKPSEVSNETNEI